jgi:cysteinyl-tRNA synthetase
VNLEEARAMVEEREAARAARDFATADRLRDALRAAGFEVVDTPGGPEVRQVEAPGAPVHRGSEDVPSLLDRPSTCVASVQWVVQGWPEDVLRGIASIRRSCPMEIQQVVVDATGGDVTDWPADEVVRVAPDAGWAAARNAGLRRATGKVVLVVDGSIEATGDVVTPLIEALRDPGVGVTGPFGITTGSLHHFHESAGPEVDAIEGYLMAFRRSLVREGVRFDEKFKFYRTADIELSFQIKDRGLRATVTEVPVTRHEHRMWANTPEDERDRLSKRNFYRFLDRWRGRTDLLVSGPSTAP